MTRIALFKSIVFATVFGVAVAIPAARAASEVNLSGRGAWKSDTESAAIQGTWSVTLRRSGDAVEGTMALTGSNLLAGGRVTGTVSGNEVVLGVVSESDTELEFMGRLHDGRVSGSWQLPAVNDGGSWSGTLIPTGTGERTE